MSLYEVRLCCWNKILANFSIRSAWSDLELAFPSASFGISLSDAISFIALEEGKVEADDDELFCIARSEVIPGVASSYISLAAIIASDASAKYESSRPRIII